MKLLKISLFAAALLVFSFGAACSSTPTSTPASSVAGLEDVVYEGGASDEALDAMLALPAQSASSPAQFLQPAANAQLPAATPPSFTWSETVGRRAGRRVPAEHLARSLGPRWRSVALFGGGPAHAHGAALNGKAYLITFASADNPKALRVFTSLTTYTPTAAAWQKLSGAKGPITAKLHSATFDNNTVVSDGGPFGGGTLVFTVTP